MNIVSKFAVENENKYKLNPNFRNNVNFVLTFLSVIIFGAFAIRPSINTIAGLLRDIDEYKKVNSVLVEKITILNEVNSDPQRLDQETQLIQSALPENPDEGNYIRNINFLAAQNNILANSVSFGVVQDGGLGAIQFNISISGEYQNVVNFLDDFNNLLRITTLESINLTTVQKDSQAINATITGKTYFYPREGFQFDKKPEVME